MNAKELLEAASPRPFVVGVTWDRDWPVNRVATMRGPTRRALELEASANAALIARAVNSFEALVAVAEGLARQAHHVDCTHEGCRERREAASALRLANGTNGDPA